MVLFWIPIIKRHLIFRVPQKGPQLLTTTHILFLVFNVCVNVEGSKFQSFCDAGRRVLNFFRRGQVGQYTEVSLGEVGTWGCGS